MTSATQKHTYKLTYFDFYGRAEITRLVFAAGNIEYEDHRVQFEDWAEFKKTMPTEKVPVLEIDGKHALVQSIAIARFAAKEASI
jgi:glutathione S-transferase